MYDFIMDPTNQIQQNPEALSNSMPTPSPTGLKPVSLLLEDTIELVKSRFLNLVIVGLIGTGLMWLVRFVYPKLFIGGITSGGVGVMPSFSSTTGALLVVATMLVLSGFLYSSLCGVLQTNNVKAALNLGYTRMFVMALFMFTFAFILMGAMLALLLPAIFVYVYGIFAIFVTAESGNGGFKAIFESYRLVRGNALGVAGRLLLLIVMMAVTSFILNMIFGDTSVLASIVSFFVDILMQVFMVSYLYAIYTNLRDAKPRPEAYEPSGLSKALTYTAFGLGFVALLIAVPVLLLVGSYGTS